MESATLIYCPLYISSYPSTHFPINSVFPHIPLKTSTYFFSHYLPPQSLLDSWLPVVIPSFFHFVLTSFYAVCPPDVTNVWNWNQFFLTAASVPDHPKTGRNSVWYLQKIRSQRYSPQGRHPCSRFNWRILLFVADLVRNKLFWIQRFRNTSIGGILLSLVSIKIPKAWILFALTYIGRKYFSTSQSNVNLFKWHTTRFGFEKHSTWTRSKLMIHFQCSLFFLFFYLYIAHNVKLCVVILTDLFTYVVNSSRREIFYTRQRLFRNTYLYGNRTRPVAPPPIIYNTTTNWCGINRRKTI